MKRLMAVTVLTIMVAVLFFGCSGQPTGTKAKGDPRDELIKTAIKTAAATSNPVEIAALFSGHPDMQKASTAEKLVLTGFLLGNITGFDLDLSKVKNIKLQVSKFSTPKRYCLDGAFSYSGPGKTGAGRIEIEDGTGTILVCTRDAKDGGAPYLDKLEFRPDGKTLSAAKKIARTGGK